MTIDLKKYLTEQYQRTISKNQEPGPVITISRQYGCAAKEYAAMLGEKLNELKKEKNEENEWTVAFSTNDELDRIQYLCKVNNNDE